MFCNENSDICDILISEKCNLPLLLFSPVEGTVGLFNPNKSLNI